MATSRKSDPLRDFKFRVSIEGIGEMGFSKISGLKEATEQIEYREGGDSETPRMIPGQTKFDPLVMEYGKSSSTTAENMRSWRSQVFKASNAGKNAPNDDFRKSMTITLVGKDGTARRKYRYGKTCWPAELELGDLDASGNDVLIETTTIANEGYEELPGSGS